jgi:predicted CXXCH cytochrome family protein
MQHSYSTKWAELTVSCESCHGQSAEHVAWARNDKSAEPPAGSFPKLGVGGQAGELAVCGPCHARREAFSGDSVSAGSIFGDHYRLALLKPGLYFADGQQQDEVYILGSFLQSKMKAKGVTCSNCHDPHSSQLIADGNAICTQCHSEAARAEFPSLKKANYDTPAHHHHKPGTDAAQCVSCHMPESNYMRIDKRRDHFFRIPDPAQSNAAGAPDVCTSCHKGESQEWAAQRINAWAPNSDRSWQDRAAFIAVSSGGTSSADIEALTA